MSDFNFKELENILSNINNNFESEDNIVTVDMLVALYLEADTAEKTTVEPYRRIKNDVKDRFREIVVKTGISNWNKLISNGQAYINDPTVKVSYDNEILDNYLKDAPPEVVTVLRLARSEKVVSGSTVIRK